MEGLCLAGCKRDCNGRCVLRVVAPFACQTAFGLLASLWVRILEALALCRMDTSELAH